MEIKNWLLTLSVPLVVTAAIFQPNNPLSTPPKNNDFCEIYQKTITTQEDTAVTKGQVDHNNDSYDCLCNEDGAACERGAKSQ